MTTPPNEHSDEKLDVEETEEPKFRSVSTVKKMILINNGDKLSRGRPYVLNANKVHTWENLLLEFSDRLKPTFGAVRRVYTPKQGTEITEMDQLETDGVYVLSGTEKFKQIPNGYNTETILNQHFNHHAPRVSLVPAKQPKELPVHFSGNDLPDLRRASLQILVVFVFRNGDNVNPPVKVMLKKFDLWNFVRAKDVISEKVKPAGGFCQNLCSLDGNPIKHITDLKNNGYYVAVGPYEKFRHVDYTPEGRPSIVVPMKLRSSFSAQTYQDAEGMKRRRTFIVRLKKNGENRIEEDDGEEEQDNLEHSSHDGIEDSQIENKNHVFNENHEKDDKSETGTMESSAQSHESLDEKVSQRSLALELPSNQMEFHPNHYQHELQKIQSKNDPHLEHHESHESEERHQDEEQHVLEQHPSRTVVEEQHRNEDCHKLEQNPSSMNDEGHHEEDHRGLDQHFSSAVSEEYQDEDHHELCEHPSNTVVEEHKNEHYHGLDQHHELDQHCSNTVVEERQDEHLNGLDQHCSNTAGEEHHDQYCVKNEDQHDGLAGQSQVEEEHHDGTNGEHEAGDHHEQDTVTIDHKEIYDVHVDEEHHEESQKHDLTEHDDEVPTPKKKKWGCCSK